MYHQIQVNEKFVMANLSSVEPKGLYFILRGNVK